MSFKIEGEYNTATVHTLQSKEEAEDEAVEQIQKMVDSEAMEGDGDVAIMPDFHWGSGACIGFTMPLKNRVVPSTIGVDIGCGMYAVNFGNQTLPSNEELDEEIRERVPTGFDVHNRSDYHMKRDFPWAQCDANLVSMEAKLGAELAPHNFSYNIEYFNDLCKRVGYDQTRAINSVGTLGGGNHFIELGRDSEGNVWCVVHSGSRGIGAAIAQYWQDVATEKTFKREATVQIPGSEVKYFKIDPADTIVEDGVYTGVVEVSPDGLEIDREAILEDYDGEAIEGKFGQLKSYMNTGKNDSSPLDYLEGEEMNGYIVDMIFAQKYASESRKEMASSVGDSIAKLIDNPVFPVDGVESIHNYIDFDDATIRKGACRAHEGERVVVPFNMSYGTILAKGKGIDSWNNSSAHGAGRAMSRTAAHDKFTEEDFEEQIGDVYMSKKPMDEIPRAYKNPEVIEAALGESIEVVDRIKPFLSVKAE